MIDLGHGSEPAKTELGMGSGSAMEQTVAGIGEVRVQVSDWS